MGQEGSRTAFDSLVTKNHVQHALIQERGEHNGIPLALTTIALLDGTPAQLKAAYDAKEGPLRSWVISPGLITTQDDKDKQLGDTRFQRAYMDYLSMNLGKMKGNAKALALDQLLTEPNPLVYGLFGGYGQALLILSDAIEIQSSLLIIESLVLAAADWSNAIFDLLTHPQLAQTPEVCLSPDVILRRIAYDGRFSGLMRSGPGFHNVSLVLSNSSARMAVIDYVHQLDIQDVPGIINQLAQLGVQLLCGAHKKEQPAFDFYLSFPLSFVQGLRVLLQSSDDALYGSVLIRGVWLLIVLAYITQLRPCLDESLVSNVSLSDEQTTWDAVFSDFRTQGDTFDGALMDTHYLRALRSLLELAKGFPDKNEYFLKAAWKLKLQWHRWTGFGNPREESLNIRL